VTAQAEKGVRNRRRAARSAVRQAVENLPQVAWISLRAADEFISLVVEDEAAQPWWRRDAGGGETAARQWRHLLFVTDRSAASRTVAPAGNAKTSFIIARGPANVCQSLPISAILCHFALDGWRRVRSRTRESSGRKPWR
jgi:hypothetical protein